MELDFRIDRCLKKIRVPDSTEFFSGKGIILSDRKSDLTHGLDWYERGFCIKKFLEDGEFTILKSEIEKSIKKIVKDILSICPDNFSLENYHKFIQTDNDHLTVVSKTRDLFADDFTFDIGQMIPKLEKIVGLQLTDESIEGGEKSHIIVRINRPGSSDFNPPHKDIYEAYDDEGYLPKFINFWIPICGVSMNSVLPISPGSHLIPENKISRTNKGSTVNDKKYRVRLIKSWDESNSLVREAVNYGEALIFSPHLIHGLSVNEQIDTTRVALEFRLYGKN